MSPILFLDIDGVLNSPAYARAERFERSINSRWPIDPACMARLNAVLAATGAAIVVSSAWRSAVNFGRLNLREFTVFLRHKGLRAQTPILGVTPDKMTGTRGHEIGIWLSENAYGRYCAVDDWDDGITACGHPLVQTNVEIGLTDTDAERLCELLGG